MRAFTRLRVSAFAMVLSLMTVLTLLQQSRYTEHLKMKIKIGGTSIDDVWHWANGDDGVEGGVRLVVFGDNWVDDRIEENGDGMGRSWTEVLCDEVCLNLSCTLGLDVYVIGFANLLIFYSLHVLRTLIWQLLNQHLPILHRHRQELSHRIKYTFPRSKIHLSMIT